MTGKEAWNLIQPHIDPMLHSEFNNEQMAEAFCMIYIACKEYDKGIKNEKGYKSKDFNN